MAVKPDEKAESSARAGRPRGDETSVGARFVTGVRETAKRADVTGMSSEDFKAKILGRKP